MKTQIRLKSEEKIADVSQFYETISLVVSRALGGGKSQEQQAPKTADELEARLARALGE